MQFGWQRGEFRPIIFVGQKLRVFISVWRQYADTDDRVPKGAKQEADTIWIAASLLAGNPYDTGSAPKGLLAP